MKVLSHTRRKAVLGAAFASPQDVASLLGDVQVPQTIASWLGRLHSLAGVPFSYLVPDERMLPPESIRFFRIDPAWTEALVDGAFSIGRNLTSDATAASLVLDRAIQPTVLAAARAAAPRRARPDRDAATSPGAPTAANPSQSVVWSGFLLRSKVVSEYPGLGVNAYPQGASGDDPTTALQIVRFERLGPDAQTLICIVDGDAALFDLHEPPERLHFGVDSYVAPAGPLAAPAVEKGLRAFVPAADGTVSLSKDSVATSVGPAFRTGSPRVLKLSAMAAIVAQHSKLTSVDAAQMGFEMTEGVGKVRFARSQR
jgi:hypothetical protein